jgi:hypothetical protein
MTLKLQEVDLTKNSKSQTVTNYAFKRMMRKYAIANILYITFLIVGSISGK